MAVIFQTLGFYVIPANRGASAVDLICVSAEARSPTTMLVEAKTCGSRYSLPAKDVRALCEYVESVRERLSTFPKPSALIIVGPECAKTVENKLASLEGEVGIPTRYIVADDIALLRESIPGPLPVHDFLRAIRLTAHVVPRDAIKRICSTFYATEAAHIEFARAVLDRKVKGGPSAWH